MDEIEVDVAAAEADMAKVEAAKRAVLEQLAGEIDIKYISSLGELGKAMTAIGAVGNVIARARFTDTGGIDVAVVDRTGKARLRMKLVAIEVRTDG